jgi:hypothetical protein
MVPRTNTYAFFQSLSPDSRKVCCGASTEIRMEASVGATAGKSELDVSERPIAVVGARPLTGRLISCALQT